MSRSTAGPPSRIPQKIEAARPSARPAAFAAVALVSLTLLTTCSREASERPPSPPLPADSSAYDQEIAARIEETAERLRKNPGDVGSWRELGMIYHAHQQLELARDCYRQGLAISPDDPKIWFYLALVERRLGNLEEAIAGLRRVNDLDRGFAPAYWRRGLWLLGDGHLVAAREALERALEVAPADPAASLALARAHLQAGEPRQAVEVLQGHLVGHPGDGYAHFLLANAYRRLDRGEDARRHSALGQGAAPEWSDPWSEELDERRAGFPARLAAATELLDQQPQKAVAELERLRSRRPDNGTVLINLGIGYRRSGRLDDSLAVLRDAVRREPGRGLAHFHLAVSLSETGDLEAALEHAGRAVELQPTSAKGHALQGELLARAGNAGEAVESYRLAVRDPQDPAWLHRLGGLLCQLQRWEEAIPVLTSFLERTEDAGALFLLGAAQANSGRLDAAAATLDRARRLDPRDPKIHQALAQLERVRGTAAGDGS